jgi:hypothetical protein
MNTTRLALSIASLALALPAHAQFSVEHLSTFGPAVCFEMNDSGQIAGDYQFMALTTPMRFTPGVGIVARSTPAGSGLGYALGINNAGACIGMLDMPGPASSAAVIWDDNNVMTELPLPAGTWTYNTGTAINDDNVACGYVTLAVVGPDTVAAWRWDAVNGYTLLPNPLGNFSGANDMNSSGVVCGINAASDTSPPRAVIWDMANQVTEIPLLPGASSNTAWSINDAGVVVGDSSNGIPWRYTPGVGVVALPKLATQASQGAVARGINNDGWVVGYAMQGGEPHTVVWDPNGVIYKISDYAGPDFYFPSDGSVPIAINDENILVVRAMDFNVSGDPRAVRFHFGYPAPDCVADIDGNDSVDVNDLLAVITTWGACADPKNCPADIVPPGGNDIVDVNDLLAVITTWGPCQ